MLTTAPVLRRIGPLRLLSLLAACMLLVPAAAAQDATIVGTVTDAQDGQPLIGANVILDGTTQGTATDIDGEYRIEDVAPGEHTLAFSYTGYQTTQRTITVAAGETMTVDAALRAGIDLDPVVVTASRQAEKVLDAPASVSVLSAQEIERDVAPSSVSVLRTTTGVDIAETGVQRSEVSLRGFNNAFSGATFVLTDYRQSAVPSLGANVYSIMPGMTLDLERIEVVRGPGSALYGAGVDAGVIHFITKDPFTYPGTTVAVSGGERSLFDGQLRHAGVVGENLGYKITGAYTRADDWEFDPDDPEDASAIADDIVPRDNGFSKYNVNGLLQYRINDETLLSANAGFSALNATVLTGIGTVQGDNFGYSYGQLRLRSGGFFAQAFLNRNNAGDSFVYATDLDQDGVPDPVVDNSVQINAQAQYDFSTWNERQQFIVGADFENTEPDTEGTINGRNEDDDTITEYGAYVQSATDLTEQLDVTLALRADYNNIDSDLQISPRAALVFKPVPGHSLRATYNRAFSSPGTNSLFLDIPARTVPLGGGYTLLFRGRGSVDGFTFSNFRETRSVAFSLPIPGLFGEQVPLDAIPVGPIYGLVANQFAETLRSGGDLPDPLPPLTPEQREGLAQVLLGLVPAVQNAGTTTSGVLTLPRGETNLFGDLAEPVDIDPLQPTTSQTIEAGYKGVFRNRILFGIDGYVVSKQDFVGPLVIESPLALPLGLAGDLTRTLAPIIEQAAAGDPQVQGFLQSLGLTPEQAAALIGEAAGDELSGTPVGVVQPDQPLADDPNTVAGFLAYRNFGTLSYWGVDATVQVNATDRISVSSNVSVVSDDFFDNEELDENDASLAVALNAPTLKVRGSASYAVPGGVSVNVSGRYNEGFPVLSGPYVGEVDSYFLLDVGAGYDFTRYVPGLRFDVSVQNALDNRHRQYVGAPQLGRMAIARLTYSM
ncbi:MAG: TonB-dependent receptor [Bacteroidetes bacterium]|jgi:iron complex outermembrane receptor protein|nr:TonB-dependent receptor [Bacteroidota bacterium]